MFYRASNNLIKKKFHNSDGISWIPGEKSKTVKIFTQPKCSSDIVNCVSSQTQAIKLIVETTFH